MLDVAKMAGVGTMTVSRVLSGTVKVSEETRSRVLDAIAKLNYQPNEIARSLREQRSRQVGIIVPNLRDPFFAVFSQSISTVAKHHSYSVVITTSNEDPETEYVEAARMLRRHIEGLIVIPALGKSRLRAKEFGQTPIVTCDRPVPGAPFDCVLVQNQSGGRMGVTHLIEHGHQRIAFLGLSRSLFTIKTRLEGYREAMLAAGLRPNAHFVGDALPEMLTTVVTLLAGKQPPTAFFCSNNLVTRNTLHALSTMNVRIPDDIALVGFDDFEMADIIRPPVTVVRQPVDLLGVSAAELLFSRLETDTPSRRVSRVVLPVELVLRDSCGSHERSAVKTVAHARPIAEEMAAVIAEATRAPMHEG
jgi:LacI family transcriptional regulator